MRHNEVKKAIFDQDSNPCCPWEPEKNISKSKQESKQKNLAAVSLEPQNIFLTVLFITSLFPLDQRVIDMQY